MTPEGCCRLLEFQVCWQMILRTSCGNSERSVADLEVCSCHMCLNELTYLLTYMYA